MTTYPTEAIHTPDYETVTTRRGVTYLVDLPGVLLANLHLTCRDGLLLVWGTRSPSGAPKEATVTHRWTGPFALDLPIPNWVEPDRIGQKFESGVLTVILPRRRESIKRSPPLVAPAQAA